MRYIPLPSNTQFGLDEYGCEYDLPKTDKAWMVWDYGTGEVFSFCNTEEEATKDAEALSKIDQADFEKSEGEWA